ncbi:unnamed protein product [Durusdinium trenchii]|uniref:Uncharacterized protein n=2 Tax=Durusdinium trenchii TaxID=1381693 RepID=A0ABP0SDW7_9DINO
MPSASSFRCHPCARHGLPECVLERADMLEGKTEFTRQLHGQTDNVTPILAAHGVKLPTADFASSLPKAKDVTPAEAAAAFGYVSSPSLAKQINRLMRAQSWSALMSEFGPVVKSLCSYIEKLESSYAAKRTLYRGMQLSQQHLQDNYVVGKVVTWNAFASVTTNRQLAETYSCESYDRGFFLDSGVPVVFIIGTQFRGALLGGWSPYPSHEELLLSPFLGFRVTSVGLEPSGTDHTRVVKMEAVKLPRSWAETAPDRLVLLHPGSMPWAAQPKEVLSELEEDLDEAVKKKLDPPGAFLLSVVVGLINASLLFLYVLGYDLDDFAISKQG